MEQQPIVPDHRAGASALAFLAEASSVLAESLDYQATLRRITQLAVPRLGDWCALDLLADDGRLERLAVAHVEPERVRWAYELYARYPPNPNAARGLWQVLRSGQPELYPLIDDALLVASAQDAEHLRILREVGMTSALIVPLRARGRTLGALSLVAAESGRRYGPADLQLVAELGGRMALAIDNARLYREAAEERERFRTTLASIGDAVIVTDAAGRVTFMNVVAARLTGWAPEDAAGHELPQVFRVANEMSDAAAENPVERVLREGQVVGLANHTVLLARDGRAIPIDDSGAPILDESGRVTGVVLVFRDITGRRAAERALQASEERYRTLVDSIPQITWVLTPDGAVDYLNRRWTEYTGLPAETQLGQRWVEVVHPDDRPGLLASRTAAIAAGEPYEATVRLRRADGAYHWHLVRVVPLRENGTIVAWFGSATDIHAHKQAEDAQRLLAEATTVLASSLDVEANIAAVAQLVVPRLADWCTVDLRRPGGAIETAAVAHSDPAQAAQGWEVLRRHPIDPHIAHGTAGVLRSGRPELVSDVSGEQLAALAAVPAHAQLAGARGIGSWMCVPLVARGAVLGTIALGAAERGRYRAEDLALAEELARRIALAIENARLYHDAREAIAVRDQFLSVAAHELKTPLTALLGYARLLQRRQRQAQTLDERDTRALQTIVTQGVRLEGLINLLLDLSRIEAGRLRLESAELDFAALVRRAVGEALPGLDEHTLTLEDAGEPLPVLGDALRLEQVVHSLIQNAVKYSPAGGAVTMQIGRQGGQAVLTVRDEGIGIPEEALPHLFERFYRAPNVEPLNISGTGVGLYVVREIVARHGGTIAVTSAENQGSTFTVHLPLATQPQS